MPPRQKLLSFCVLLIFLLSCSEKVEEKNAEQFDYPSIPERKVCADKDGDGFSDKLCGGNDCDDSNPSVNPDAYDVCGDKLDNNCDGVIDNPPTPELELTDFIFGTSFGSGVELDYLQSIGIHWIRNDIYWKDVMPEVTDINIDLAYVLQHPELADELAQSVDWSTIDAKIKNLLEHGLNPIITLGHGYKWFHSKYHGEPATPDRIGKEAYLAHMYLYSRAVVERYDGDGYMDADGIVVKFWQLENELNQAMFTAVWRWRSPEWIDGLSSAWADWKFLDVLLWTLSKAVKDADPSAITLINLHSDIPDEVCNFFGIPTWLEAAALWRDYADIIGFDAYPNYVTPNPVMGEVVGERVRQVIEASCGKPTMIVETDYPTGPAILDFTPEAQAEYISEAFWSAYDAGAIGFLKLAVRGPDAHWVEITDEDVENIRLIRNWWLNENFISLGLWALAHLKDMLHIFDVIASVEGYWGMIKSDETPKPSYYVMADIANFLNSQNTARTPMNGKNGKP